MQKRLFQISIITLFVSLIILTIFSLTLEPKITPISKIERKNLDEFIKIKGRIEKITKINTTHENITILKIRDKIYTIETIFYKDLDSSCNDVEIIGKVSEYENKLQIEAKKIKCLK